MPRVAKDPNVPVFDFQENPEKAALSATTKNIYRNYLNKITAASYDQSLADKRLKVIKNKTDLMSKHKRVVDIINKLAETRQAKCGYYSAVFYAVGTKNLKKNKRMSYLTEEFRKIYFDDKYKDYLAKKNQTEVDAAVTE